MKVQIKRKGVREEKMDKKGEKMGEGGAALSLECPWFCNTKSSGSQKGEQGEGIDQQWTTKKFSLWTGQLNRICQGHSTPSAPSAP